MSRPIASTHEMMQQLDFSLKRQKAIDAGLPDPARPFEEPSLEPTAPVAADAEQATTNGNEASANRDMYIMPTPQTLREIKQARIRKEYIEPARAALKAAQDKAAAKTNKPSAAV